MPDQPHARGGAPGPTASESQKRPAGREGTSRSATCRCARLTLNLTCSCLTPQCSVCPTVAGPVARSEGKTETAAITWRRRPTQPVRGGATDAGLRREKKRRIECPRAGASRSLQTVRSTVAGTVWPVGGRPASAARRDSSRVAASPDPASTTLRDSGSTGTCLRQARGSTLTRSICLRQARGLMPTRALARGKSHRCKS